jgi:hypothetical protein
MNILIRMQREISFFVFMVISIQSILLVLGEQLVFNKGYEFNHTIEFVSGKILSIFFGVCSEEYRSWKELHQSI